MLPFIWKTGTFIEGAKGFDDRMSMSAHIFEDINKSHR